ncbi:MAG: haloacid dehalogenase type II [Myxococcota bacterium]
MSGTRAVLFDAFGTLFDVQGVEGRCTELVGPAGPALTLGWREAQLRYSWLASLMDRWEPFDALTARALDYAAALTGVTLTADARAELLAAYDSLPLFPEVAGALARLGATPLAVLSNGSPAMLDAGLEAAGIASRFAHVFSASQARTFKPSPRVYALATNAMGAPAESCLFVSSNNWDVAGAAAFGFRAVYLNRSGRPEEAVGGAAMQTIASLDALAALL